MDTTSVKNQTYCSIINIFNEVRWADEFNKLNIQDHCYVKAMKEISKVREFIGTLEHIMGNSLTKHGEIAEQVEVGLRRAKSVLAGNEPIANFDGIGRTTAADYRIGGELVQSKFINGLSNNLDSVIRHTEQYEGFKCKGTFFHIPKDNYEKIIKIYNNEAIEGLNQKTIKTVQAQIKRIEEEIGRSFSDVVRPGISKYAEVQQGKIHETMDKHEQELRDENENYKTAIKNEHKVNLSEGLKAAGAAAAVGGGISLCSSLYSKYKSEGKNLFRGDLTLKDWQEIGINTVKDSAIAGVTGLGIYGLTNCVGLSAPLASAFVTATQGVGSLVRDYKFGKITWEEFKVNSIFICTDSAVVCLATVAGQKMIPIPILGGLIGLLAGKIISTVLLGKDDKLAKEMAASMQEFLQSIDRTYQSVINKINDEFDRIEDLRSKAFDFKTNMSMVETSIGLAQAYNVPEDKILKNKEDIKSYLFN